MILAACLLPLAIIIAAVPSSAIHKDEVVSPDELLQSFNDGVHYVTPDVIADVLVQNEPDKIRDALGRQAASPVRWVEIIRYMAGIGITHVIECGPGKVLSALVKRIDGSMQAHALADRASFEQALATVKQA